MRSQLYACMILSRHVIRCPDLRNAKKNWTQRRCDVLVRPHSQPSCRTLQHTSLLAAQEPALRALMPCLQVEFLLMGMGVLDFWPHLQLRRDGHCNPSRITDHCMEHVPLLLTATSESRLGTFWLQRSHNVQRNLHATHQPSSMTKYAFDCRGGTPHGLGYGACMRGSAMHKRVVESRTALMA